MTKVFIQIFSMTDHAKALNERYRGPYAGINADVQTAELKNNQLFISKNSKSQAGGLDPDNFDSAQAILCYRHSDTGELQGTSEMLIPIQNVPWTDMPGIEIKAVTKTSATVKLWIQEIKLKTNSVVRVHFMKTIAYLRYLGEVDEIVWTDEILTNGPALLHSEPVEQDLTIAPPGSSGLQVKMGQEVAE